MERRVAEAALLEWARRVSERLQRLELAERGEEAEVDHDFHLQHDVAMLRLVPGVSSDSTVRGTFLGGDCCPGADCGAVVHHLDSAGGPEE